MGGEIMLCQAKWSEKLGLKHVDNKFDYLGFLLLFLTFCLGYITILSCTNLLKNHKTGPKSLYICRSIFLLVFREVMVIYYIFPLRYIVGIPSLSKILLDPHGNSYKEAQVIVSDSSETSEAVTFRWYMIPCLNHLHMFLVI